MGETNMKDTQMTLENESLLDSRIKESNSIIEVAIKKSASVPLIVNFSGGKDSSVLLDLVQKVTDNFVCCYMISSIEFPEAIEFAKASCKRLGKKLLLSDPSYYKGDFFERLRWFRYFPTVRATWCSRDLKWRPQKRMLTKIYGKEKFFKLNGVRRFESSRRKKMHIATPRKGFMFEDYDVTNDIMVFPILNWTTKNVLGYLEQRKIEIMPNPLYDVYGVSGCYWCPFYQPSIYKRILTQDLNLLDRFIEWEEKLEMPSVSGFKWLRDIKEKVGER